MPSRLFVKVLCVYSRTRSCFLYALGCWDLCSSRTRASVRRVCSYCPAVAGHVWTRAYPWGLSFNVGVSVCSHLASMELGERSHFYSPFKTLNMIQMCVFSHVPWLHSSLTITPSQYPLLSALPHLYIPPSCPATTFITSAVSGWERWSHLCSSVFCVCGPSAARL